MIDEDSNLRQGLSSNANFYSYFFLLIVVVYYVRCGNKPCRFIFPSTRTGWLQEQGSLVPIRCGDLPHRETTSRNQVSNSTKISDTSEI